VRGETLPSGLDMLAVSSGDDSMSGTVVFAGCKPHGGYQLHARMVLECCGRGARAVLFPSVRTARGLYGVLKVY